jgi:hypothetical protein
MEIHTLTQVPRKHLPSNSISNPVAYAASGLLVRNLSCPIFLAPGRTGHQTLGNGGYTGSCFQDESLRIVSVFYQTHPISQPTQQPA